VKLLFSEAAPDYASYTFPYVVWAFPEHETPADLFAAGFLASTPDLQRFYLCRHTRVNLAQFSPSSENRRILRRGENLRFTLVPRAGFEFTPARLEFCRRYTAEKFPPGMSEARLTRLFSSAITTHVLVASDPTQPGVEIGFATLYLEPGRAGFYSYSFYDLAHPNRSLGLFLMTSALIELARQGYPFAYLGTCYADYALYKTQFAGFEFFNGVRWSANVDELKSLLRRQAAPESRGHLLEDSAFATAHELTDLAALAAASRFRA
jgi:hypothetical protein